MTPFPYQSRPAPHLTIIPDGHTEEPSLTEQPLSPPMLFSMRQAPPLVRSTATAAQQLVKPLPPAIEPSVPTPPPSQNCHLTVMSELRPRCASTAPRRCVIAEASHIPSWTRAHRSLRQKPVSTSPVTPPPCRSSHQ